MDNFNILLVGVGGQGIVMASNILGNVAKKKSYDVKIAEIHGMSQRGGCVETYVKYGEKIYSPLIEKGEADIIIGLEQLEVLRWIDYIKKDGKIISSEQRIDPLTVVSGSDVYPENIVEKITDYNRNVISIDAIKIAKDSGNVKCANTVLIGIVAKLINIEKEIWIETIKEVIPKKFQKYNLKAFELGYEYIDKYNMKTMIESVDHLVAASTND